MNGEHKIIFDELKLFRKENREDHKEFFKRLDDDDKELSKVQTTLKFYKKAILGIYGLLGAALIIFIRAFILKITNGG